MLAVLWFGWFMYLLLLALAKLWLWLLLLAADVLAAMDAER